MASRGSCVESQSKPPAKKWSSPWRGPLVSHLHLLGGRPICRLFLGRGVLGWVEVMLCGGGDACGAAASAHPCWPLLSQPDVLTSSPQVRRAAMCWCRSCGRRSGSCCRWSVPWSRWPSAGSMPTTCSSSCGGQAPAWLSDPPRRALPKLPRGRSSGPACPSSPGSPI